MLSKNLAKKYSSVLTVETTGLKGIFYCELKPFHAIWLKLTKPSGPAVLMVGIPVLSDSFVVDRKPAQWGSG